MTDPSELLAKGLLAGFAGKSAFGTSSRGAFTVTSSEVLLPEDAAQYIDQWVGKRSGGGQEIVQSAGGAMTRVYAGGTVPQTTLDTLGITDDQIMAYLKEKLSALNGQTRLMAAVPPILDGYWQYAYELMDTDGAQIVTGKETILYKNTPVFVHVFVMAPVS